MYDFSPRRQQTVRDVHRPYMECTGGQLTPVCRVRNGLTSVLDRSIHSLRPSLLPRFCQLGWGGLFPFEWARSDNDLKSFSAMKVSEVHWRLAALHRTTPACLIRLLNKPIGRGLYALL